MDNLRLKQLSLTNFRLHRSLILDFSPQTTLILGLNASGKTAIIEALYLLATGDSFRAKKIEEMIAFGQELGRVKLKMEDRKLKMEEGGSQDELEVLLTRGVVQGKKTQYRLFSINEIRKRKKDFVGQFKTVLFRPEDMRLIEGSPARRRSFMDEILSQVSYEYRVGLKTYENTLKRRNRLLLAVREGEQSKNALSFWNLSLIKNGQLIQELRRKLIDELDQFSFPVDYQVLYRPKIINEARLTQYLPKEIAAGHSLVGPHKDDFQVLYLDKTQAKFLDVATFGSRGQQRLAVLWLKAGAGAYLQAKTRSQVVWLLDDILSELDRKSRQLVLSLLKGRQVIITSASQRIKEVVKAQKTVSL